MNKPLPILVGTLSFLAAFAAQANDSKVYGVSSINVQLSGGTPEITVANVANSKNIDHVQLAAQGNAVSVGVSGHVDCTGTQIENWQYREGHFLSRGAFGIGRTSLIQKKDLANSSSIDRVSAMGAENFQVSLQTLAGAQIGINPAALVMAAANSAPDKLQYLRQNRTIDVKIPIRWEAGCAPYTRNKVTKKTIIESPETSYITKDVTLRIKYVGDPQLFRLNPVIVNQGMGGFQAGPQNFIKITGGSFIEGAPVWKNKCPGSAAFKVRVNGQGSGSVRVRINDGSTTIATSPALELKDGKVEYAFNFNVPYGQLNKEVPHNFRIFYTAKAANENFFPASYQFLSAWNWKHTCIRPVTLSVGVGGQGGIQQQPQQGNAPAALQVKPAAPPAVGTIQAVPVPPAPATAKPAARTVAPTRDDPPKMKLVVPAKPAEPEPRPAR